MQHLVIGFAADADDGRDAWWLIDDKEGCTASGTDLAQARAAGIVDPAGRRAVGVVPADAGLCMTVTVPGRQRGQMQSALPWQVEEFLAGDLDQFHIAHASLQPGRPVRVVAMPDRAMAAWLARARDAGLALAALYADAELLTLDAGDAAAVLHRPERWLLRTADQAVAIDGEVGVLAATRMLDDAPAGAIAWFGSGAHDDGIARNALAASTGRVIEERAAAGDSGIAWVENACRGGHDAVNLLQGRYLQRRDGDAGPLWHGVRRLAVLASAWLAVYLALQAGQAWWMERQAQAVDAEMVALYQQLFPDERTVRDPLRQMRQHLGDSGASTPGALELLSRVAPVLGSRTDVRIGSINVTADRGDAAVDLSVDSYAGLDALKSALDGAGLRTEIASAEQDGDIVRARLRIQAGAAG